MLRYKKVCTFAEDTMFERIGRKIDFALSIVWAIAVAIADPRPDLHLGKESPESRR